MHWNKDMEVGIPQIDHQHQHLLEYIRKVSVASASGTDMNQLLDELVDYALTHFAFEESLRRKMGCKPLRSDDRAHALYITRRIASFEHLASAGEDVADEVVAMLEEWLYGHIDHDGHTYSLADVNSVKGVAGIMLAKAGPHLDSLRPSM